MSDVRSVKEIKKPKIKRQNTFNAILKEKSNKKSHMVTFEKIHKIKKIEIQGVNNNGNN